MSRAIKAAGLLSGGLDSILAARLLLEQGIRVQGISFLTPFFGPERAIQAAEQLGIPLEIIDITEGHWKMLKGPRYGYGKGLNPCIDCHALMVRQAGKMVEEQGFDFIFTGEVLGQRPFSQTRPSLRAVEKESGFVDRILRPLSARLLPETRPEKEGLVDRSLLLDIQGRSRRRQMALADHFGIRDYPAPAGGCLLTDPVFSRRLKELLSHNPDPLLREVELLKTGRHFRLVSGLKIVVGRNQGENECIEKRIGPEDIWARTVTFPGPLVLASGWINQEEDWETMARLCLSYSDAPQSQPVPVQMGKGERRWTMMAVKEWKERFREWMI
jgi:tRNA U34 2-thiouridine synthase MnmA/TrmU